MIFLFFIILYTTEADLFESEQDKDYEIIMRDLEELRNNPIDINTADFNELTRIPFLTINDCLKIIEYRQRYGAFASFEEMLNITGFNRLFIEKIKPYISIGGKAFRFHKLAIRGRLKTKLPEDPGSIEYYTRSSCSYGDYNSYLVTERDSYERSFFDYYASGIIVRNNSRIFALGKYNLDIGSGVMLSPLGSFFGAADFRILIKERGVLPYTSVLENSGFFGSAFSDSLWTNFTVFYSNQKLDGRIDTSGNARSFDVSGEHTDSLSCERKDGINEEIYGFNANYRIDDLYVANQTYICSYDPQFACSDSLVGFYGDNFWMTGVSLKYLRDDFILFSEVARSFKDRIGGLFGCSGFLPFFDIALAGKYFPAGYYSPKGVEAEDNYAGGVFNVNKNFRHFTIGMLFTMDSKLDQDTAQYGLRLNFERSASFFHAKLQVRWRYHSQKVDLAGSRVFLRLQPDKRLFFDLRLEDKYVFELEGVERGIFGGLEAGLEIGDLKLRARYGLFNTASYASRIYVYEIDLPGIVTNRMLYPEGNYGFLYGSFKLFKVFKLSAKYLHIERASETDRHIGVQLDVNL